MEVHAAYFLRRETRATALLSALPKLAVPGLAVRIWFDEFGSLGVRSQKVMAMLPFDNRPWAKPLARVVIGIALLAAGLGAWYLYTLGELYIPEVTGIVLLLLTIVPPNVAVLMKRPEGDRAGGGSGDPAGTVRSAGGPRLHHR